MKTINETIIQKVLDYIKEHQVDEGKSPTYRQIMHHCNLSSMSVVYRYINILKERGQIEQNPWSTIDISSNLRSEERLKNVPLVGTVACGQPLLAVENIEGNFRLPVDIVGSTDAFMLRAKGPSMINAGIKNGDILIVRKQNYADPGQIIIALIEDEATAKRYYPKKDYILLKAENDTLDADGKRKYDVKVKNCEILGVVIGNYHKF